MKKVLFINALNPNDEVETRYPNLGIGYLISSLRKHFGNNAFEFKVVDRNIKSIILKFNPHVVAITCTSPNYDYAKKYASFASKRNIPVIIGGVHISMLPDTLSDDMNVGCIGEGEETIIELFSLFLQENAFPSNKLKKIKGLVFKENRKTIRTGARSLIKDMDIIPFPARDLLDIKKHTHMFSSRGCPYRCTFCSSSVFWANVRFFSAEYVVKEIRELITKYGVKFITFYDDLFILDKNRLRQIVNLLKKQYFYKKVKFSCLCRSNLVNHEIAQLLKEMNVVSVALGIESSNGKVLSFLKGDSVTIQHNIDAIEILKKYKIAVNASFIIGSPSETQKEIMQTYNFIKSSSIDLSDVYVITPYPGTPIWEYALRRGLVSTNMDWERLNVSFERNKNGIILSESLSRDEIYSIYRKFKRLILFKNLKKIWTHPFLIDLPKYIYKIIIEKLNLIKQF